MIRDVMQQDENGKWVEAMPLRPSFGVRWEIAWRTRRRNGSRLLAALVRGWFDARAAAPPEANTEGTK